MCVWIGESEGLLVAAKTGDPDVVKAIFETAYLTGISCNYARGKLAGDDLHTIATDSAARFSDFVQNNEILSPGAYLHSILRTQIAEHFQALARDRLTTGAEILATYHSHTRDISEQLANEELLRRAFSIIENDASSDCLLSMLDDIPDSEIARRAGLSENTIRKRRQRLREELLKDQELASVAREIHSSKRRDKKFVRKGRVSPQKAGNDDQLGLGSPT